MPQNQDDPHKMFDLPKSDPPKKTKPTDAAPSMEDLLKRMDEQDKQFQRLQSENDVLRRSNMQLMAQPRSAPQPAPAPAKETPLPNPMDDPDAYAREVQRRADAHAKQQIEEFQQQQKSSQQTSAQLEQLWSEFSERYENLAEHEGLVEYAAGKVVKAASARGVDVDSYIFNARDQFFEDVAAEMKKVLPEPEPENKGNAEPNRTGGMFGGQESGGRPEEEDGPKDGTDLFSQLHQMQREAKIF